MRVCVCSSYVYYFVFFFKQKTAYDMRISDWSSDVCSSDLGDVFPLHDIFPILAEAFDIPLTEPRPVDVAGELAKLAHLWPAVVDRHGLQAPRDLDALLGATPQIVSAWGESMPPARRLMSGLTSTIKLRQAGFHGCADSHAPI